VSDVGPDELPDPGDDVEDLSHLTHDQVAERVRDAVAAAVAGTDWCPPGGVLVDCVVMLGWFSPGADAPYGGSHLRHGSPWATHGLVEDQFDRMTQLRDRENAPHLCDDENDD